ncbi:Bis(5'-adenosyl)-triphosphatase enpp4 [Nymphon striatum]|nr:Bis(5'-adenosyl)-triphosphatase enpp4 [Nymphon striatum]
MSVPLLLVVLFDGLGHNEFTQYYKEFGNLTKAHDECVTARNGVIPVFPTLTTPNLMSISTGLYSESHFITGNKMKPTNSSDLHEHPFELFTESDEDGTWFDNGVSMPIWTLNEMASTPSSKRHSGGMLWAGSGAPYRKKKIKYYKHYDANVSWYDEVDEVLKWFTDKTEPANCVFLYFDEPDLTNHEHGPNSPEVKLQIDRVDGIIGYLMDKINEHNLKDSLNIIFTSDHGVVEIPPGNFNEINKLKIPTSQYETNKNGVIWHINPYPKYYGAVYNAFLEGSKFMNYSFWDKRDFPKSAHFKNGKYVGSMILVSDLGFITVPYAFQNLKINTIGGHGYNNTHPEMRSFFLARGPAFNTSVVLDTFKNVDLYPLMCSILNLNPGPNNGTFNRVSAMLNVKSLFPSSEKAIDYAAISVGIVLVILVIVVLTLFGHRMYQKYVKKSNAAKYGLVSDGALMSDTDSDGL